MSEVGNVAETFVIAHIPSNEVLRGECGRNFCRALEGFAADPSPEAEQAWFARREIAEVIGGQNAGDEREPAIVIRQAQERIRIQQASADNAIRHCRFTPSLY